MNYELRIMSYEIRLRVTIERTEISWKVEWLNVQINRSADISTPQKPTASCCPLWSKFHHLFAKYRAISHVRFVLQLRFLLTTESKRSSDYGQFTFLFHVTFHIFIFKFSQYGFIRLVLMMQIWNQKLEFRFNGWNANIQHPNATHACRYLL